MDIKKAIQLLDQGDLNESMDILNLLVKEEATKVSALYWRASVWLRKEKYHNAINDLNAAIEIYDEYADAYSQRGVVHFHMGTLHLALKDMNKAVELEPNNPYRYSSRAYIQGHLKQTELAIQDYKKAIELDPEDAVAQNNLGLLEEQMGYGDIAQKRYEKADQLAVNNNGELIEQKESETKKEDESKNTIQTNKTQANSKRSLIDVLKTTLTTKKGFGEYWKFMKSKFK